MQHRQRAAELLTEARQRVRVVNVLAVPIVNLSLLPGLTITEVG